MTVDSKQSFSIHIFFNEILYVQTCKYPALKVIGPQKNTCTVFSLVRKLSETETWVTLAHVWVRRGGDSDRVINDPTRPKSLLTCEHQPLQEPEGPGTVYISLSKPTPRGCLLEKIPWSLHSTPL